MHRLVIIAALALVACGDGPTEPPPPEVTGAWEGSTGSISVQVTLVQGAGGNVSGSGSGSIDGTSDAFTVTQGSFTYPHLSLTLAIQGFAPFNYSGEMTRDDVIAGTLNGSGFENVNLTIRRR